MGTETMTGTPSQETTVDSAVTDLRRIPAQQQPPWHDPVRARQIGEQLGFAEPLVRAEDVRNLRALLAAVSLGEAVAVQAGDCAEDPAECTRGYVARKVGVLELLAGALMLATHKPVVRIGRIGGQFAKPRSAPVERVGGRELPVYRGHLVNAPEPDPELRKADPDRMMSAYQASGEVLGHLGWGSGTGGARLLAPVWTSHEALVLDYEIPLLRRDVRGDLLLTSTHLPWIGDRTRQVDGAHVALLARVANPVACKVGPGMTRDDLLAVCERLDPDREPGRLTLIARMGEAQVARMLPPLVGAVRAAGHPVIWLSDPMHGNTVKTADGLKTRFLRTVMSEVRQFQVAVRSAGGVAGGLHLETTPDEVTECVPTAAQIEHVGDKYTSFCDPRLNPRQALRVVSAWLG
ncbi:3-deoxy-7-phosphoheptulonate synthase [Sciscionella sediminilitoris]|uniref:3-deoxy-7-phosphoheptulonate synthase n=1 Tax=Sciscionella sediminilitoris TaxID=1445613 RepID=UPI0007C8777D|nr:3-deoxy-7-phosphoheptulonate synthase [Sciscionella sp. SE31]